MFGKIILTLIILTFLIREYSRPFAVEKIV
jgi:hypothetical protein